MTDGTFNFIYFNARINKRKNAAKDTVEITTKMHRDIKLYESRIISIDGMLDEFQNISYWLQLPSSLLGYQNI